MSKKLLICSVKGDQSNVSSIVNHLCSITYNHLDIGQLDSKSPLRIIETTIKNQQIEFWHLTENQTDNLPMICTTNLDGLVLVSNESVTKFLNANSLLFDKKRNLPILWLSKQIDSTISGSIQLQSDYSIKHFNYSLLDSIQAEFNNWLQQTY